MSVGWLILVAVLVAVLAPLAVMKLIFASFKRGASMPGAAPHVSDPNGFRQSEHESREEFVRRYWQRSGVVADGVTLVDLYDRIRALEERVARAEGRSDAPPRPGGTDGPH